MKKSINTLPIGEFFKILTLEHLKKGAIVPEKASKTVYVYDGYNRVGKCWNYHPVDDVNDDRHTKDKNKPVTTDFEY